MRLWRKLTFCIIAFFFVTSLISVFAETREQREVEMAEKSILGSIAVFATPAGHDLCAKVPIACVGANRAELALALIGARETPISGAALLRLLRFRMDGALSEDYECYVLKHSAHSKIYLKQLKPVELERKCRSEVALLVANDKQSFEGLDSGAVCASQDQIRRRIEELSEAIRAGRHCAAGDF